MGWGCKEQLVHGCSHRDSNTRPRGRWSRTLITRYRVTRFSTRDNVTQEGLIPCTPVSNSVEMCAYNHKFISEFSISIPFLNNRLSCWPEVVSRKRRNENGKNRAFFAPAPSTKKVKERIAVNGFPSHSYGTSLIAIWDHTVLPATRHKRTRPALTPASKLVLDLPTPEGWKTELT